MYLSSSTTVFRSVIRNALFAVAALALGACASAPPAPAPEVQDMGEGGFVITETVDVSGEVRLDFDQAVRFLEAGQYQQAITLLERVTEKAPEATMPYIDLGIAYARIDDLEKAEARIRKALELNPRHPVAHNELGMIQRQTGRFSEARQSYESALSLHPQFHYARLNLAILCDMYLADLDCALRNYERYSEAVPDDEQAAIWIADLQSRVGE
jgi:Tfp pilus assembly protein PilF